MPNLMIAGETVGNQHVRLLATMLDGHPLAKKLELALENGNAIVALTQEDRERMLEILRDPAGTLGSLRNTLIRQRDRNQRPRAR